MTDGMQSIRVLETSRAALPDGYQMRPAAMEDMEAAVHMMNAWSRQAIGREKFDLEHVRMEWQEPGYDLENDSRLVIAPDGQIAGFQEVFDPGQPHVRIHCWGVVDPRYSGLGLDAELLAWAEWRSRQSIEAAPPDARVVLLGHCLSSQASTLALLQQSGFIFMRHALRMVIELNGEPPTPVWPDKITVRSMIPGQEERAVVEAARDAFKDHWGFVESSFEEEHARWQHFMQHNPDYDPSLWFLAMHGEQIAGISLCWPKARDDDEMGWVGTLGVRRAWRRRGIALALLQHSFAELWQRGKRRIGLGVDAQSLTGATRLYEKAGMRSDPQRQISIYEKELRSGIELSTQSLGL